MVGCEPPAFTGSGYRTRDSSSIQDGIGALDSCGTAVSCLGPRVAISDRQQPSGFGCAEAHEVRVVPDVREASVASNEGNALAPSQFLVRCSVSHGASVRIRAVESQVQSTAAME